ncbi:MAG: MFS transporter [Candidatus Methanomethylophilaceae archaeon]|nr:MFS transporter [Candidatus Methanomethylophilaceae archaeon]
MNRYIPLILVICLVTFMDYMDSTIIFIAGPAVSLFFEVGVSDGSWLVIGYDLILCAMLIPLSKLAKRGHARNMLIVGLSIFIVGTVMCFFSDFNYWVLIAFRVIEGIGAVLCAATLPILIVTMFPEDMQGRVTGAMLTGAGVSMILAPILGGWLTGEIGWQYIFLVNVPICIAALILSIRYVPKNTRSGRAHFDIKGMLLSVIFVVSMLMFFEDVVDGGLIVIAYAAVCVMSGCLLVLHIRAHGDNGIISHSILANKEFRILSTSMLLAVMLIEGMLFLIPYYLEIGWGMSAFESGVFYAIISVSVVFISIPVGRICETKGCRNVLTLGCILSAAFSLLFIFMEESWGSVILVLTLLTLGTAYAIYETAHYVRLIRHMPGPLKDEAATFGTMISFLGASLGVSIFDIFVDVAISQGLGTGFRFCCMVCIVMAALGAILTLSVRNMKDGAASESS